MSTLAQLEELEREVAGYTLRVQELLENQASLEEDLRNSRHINQMLNDENKTLISFRTYLTELLFMWYNKVEEARGQPGMSLMWAEYLAIEFEKALARA